MEVTHLFVTDNLKLAMALTAAGFHITVPNRRWQVLPSQRRVNCGRGVSR
jgi:thiamine monophosphate synthase